MKSNAFSTPGLVSVKSLQPFLNLIEKRTGRLSLFLKQIGEKEEFFFYPGSHVTHDKWREILDAADEYLNDPLMAIEAVENSPLWWPEALVYVFKTSENLVEGFEKVFEYRKLFHSSKSAGLTKKENEVQLFLEKSSGAEEPFFVSDFITAAWLKAARLALQDSQLKPTRVGMTYPQPKHWKKLEEYYQAPIDFSCEKTEIHFSLQDMHRPLPERDAFLASLITQHIQSILKSHPVASSFRGQVEKLISDHVSEAELSAAQIAEMMSMSERSFYRKLSQEKLSFQKIHDSIRRSLAENYLINSTKTFTEISFLLGFKEVSSFSRSFKKWTGSSPSDYRQSHRKHTLTKPEGRSKDHSV